MRDGRPFRKISSSGRDLILLGFLRQSTIGMAGATRDGDDELDSAQRNTTAGGPSQCASRDRASDAAEAVKELAQMMNQMDPDLVKRLVQAREVATNIYKAFPEGDQRFAPADWDSDEGEEIEVDGDPVVPEDKGQPGEGSSAYETIGEPCKGLLDDRMDINPEACLKRAKEEYEFDMVVEMDTAKLDFFERIRLVNYLRRIVHEGMGPVEAMQAVRLIVERRDKEVLANDSLLEPYVQGDLLLTVLETEEEIADSEYDRTDDVVNAVQSSLREANIFP